MAPNLQFKVYPLFKLLIDVVQDSRRKFNLIVSAETLVYKQVARIGKSSNGHLRSGGGLLEIMGLIHLGPCVFQIFPKSQSPNLWQPICVWAHVCGSSHGSGVGAKV